MNTRFASRVIGICIGPAMVANEPLVLAQEPSPVDSARVLYSTTVQKEDGGKVTFERIEPPVVPAPTAAPATAPESGTEVTPRWVGSLAAGAQIYEGSLSEVSWWHEGRAYRAWSSLDFRLLTSVGVVGDAERSWNVILSMSMETRQRYDEQARRMREAGVRMAPWPEFSQEMLAAVPSGRRSWYLLTEAPGTPQQIAAACEAMDALHHHVEAQWDALHAAKQQREADVVAAAAWKAAHPEPKVKDTVIRFWPVKSAVNLPASAGAPTNTREEVAP